MDRYVCWQWGIVLQEGGLLNGARHLYENTIKQPLECVKIFVPAIIYVLQNNLLYVALSNLEAATFQVRLLIILSCAVGGLQFRSVQCYMYLRYKF